MIIQTHPLPLENQLNKQIQIFMHSHFDIVDFNDQETKEELSELYWSKPNYQLIAFEDNEIVGTASLTIRVIKYKDREIKIAGLGGLVVAKEYRGKGIAKELIKQRLEMAKELNCDIAFLNTNIQKLSKLFEGYGFKVLNKEFTFIGRSGTLHSDTSGMIAPIGPIEVFNEILNDSEPFFIGESNI